MSAVCGSLHPLWSNWDSLAVNSVGIHFFSNLFLGIIPSKVICQAVDYVVCIPLFLLILRKGGDFILSSFLAISTTIDSVIWTLRTCTLAHTTHFYQPRLVRFYFVIILIIIIIIIRDIYKCWLPWQPKPILKPVPKSDPKLVPKPVSKSVQNSFKTNL